MILNDDSLIVNSGTWQHVGIDTFIRKHEMVSVEPSEYKELGRTINPDGGYLYWCIGIDGDTLSLLHKLAKFDNQEPTMMQQLHYADTVQPNSSNHAAVEPFIAHYPTHSRQQDDNTDAAFHAAMFPLLVMITVGYLVKSAKDKCWVNLFRDLTT
jgi:hypothetical protein